MSRILSGSENKASSQYKRNAIAPAIIGMGALPTFHEFELFTLDFCFATFFSLIQVLRMLPDEEFCLSFKFLAVENPNIGRRRFELWAFGFDLISPRSNTQPDISLSLQSSFSILHSYCKKFQFARTITASDPPARFPSPARRTRIHARDRAVPVQFTFFQPLQIVPHSVFGAIADPQIFPAAA
jgi:hypothetical protein